jgi:hypothetical protein
VSLQANTQALMSLAGFDASDVLLTAWDNDTFRPCHYVAVDRTRQCLVSCKVLYAVSRCHAAAVNQAHQCSVENKDRHHHVCRDDICSFGDNCMPSLFLAVDKAR